MKRPVEVAIELDDDTLREYAEKGYLCTFRLKGRTHDGYIFEDENERFYLWEPGDDVVKCSSQIPDGVLMDVQTPSSRHVCAGITCLDGEYKPKRPRRHEPVGQVLCVAVFGLDEGPGVLVEY